MLVTITRTGLEPAVDSRLVEALPGSKIILIQPVLSNESFLADIAAAEAGPGVFHLWWIGQSGYLIKWGDRHLLVDPYLSDSLTEKYAGTDKPHVRMTARVVAPERLDFINIVTSSHNHTDHLDPGTLLPLLKVNPQVKLIIPEANRIFAAERLGIDPALPLGLDHGEAPDLAGFRFTGIASAHNQPERDKSGRYKHLGYIIRFGPWSLYHSGDTVLYDGLAERLKTEPVDLAILPINGNVPERGIPGNLNGKEAAGLDVISDGEQTRLDFNLSFYGFLTGIEPEESTPRKLGPPGHDQRGRHRISGTIDAPQGLGKVKDFLRLKELAPDGPALKASVPGPYTLSGRLIPSKKYPDRYAVTEALIPIVRQELTDLVEAGCGEITVDEPSMSCYAYKEDTARLVDIFNRTVEPVAGKCRLSTHLCFGNYKGRAVGPRRYAPMFPAFLDVNVDEIHLEMAGREFAEIELIESIAAKKDVAVGVIDVKSYYIETPEDVAERVRLCLKYAPPERLSFAPDCGLSQTARWAARQKLSNMVAGVRTLRDELRLSS